MRRQNVFWIVLVAVASVVCWRAAQSAPVKDEDAELYRLFVDALETIDRNYVREVDRRKLIEAAISGMLDELDPHSNFINREELPRFEREMTGKFGGIGIHVPEKHKDADFLEVSSPLVGTPAYEAGILAGDRILKVNGQSVKGLRQREIVDRISGPPGTKVTLTILHPRHEGDPIDLTLTRAVIHVPNVYGDRRGPNDEWNFFLDEKQRIAHVRVLGFNQGTSKELETTVRQLLKDGMRGLILDLRYNPGGLLTAAVEVADLFLSEGLIVKTKGPNTQDRPHSAKLEGTLPDFPMAILVNDYSASASEIVAACLQDHRRSVIVGQRTYGKGNVQNIIELEGGKSALKLTTATYRRPNDKNIHRFPDSTEKDDWGVRPSPGLELPYTNADHRKYWLAQSQRDIAHGKSPARVPGQAGPAQPERKEAAKPPAPKSAPAGKPAGEETGFEDRQLTLALDSVRGQIARSTAKAEEPKK